MSFPLLLLHTENLRGLPFSATLIALFSRYKLVSLWKWQRNQEIHNYQSSSSGHLVKDGHSWRYRTMLNLLIRQSWTAAPLLLKRSEFIFRIKRMYRMSFIPSQPLSRRTGRRTWFLWMHRVLGGDAVIWGIVYTLVKDNAVFPTVLLALQHGVGGG